MYPRLCICALLVKLINIWSVFYTEAIATHFFNIPFVRISLIMVAELKLVTFGQRFTFYPKATKVIDTVV